MFRVPFEQALSPIVFEEIDEVQERKRFPEFRVVAKSQSQLLDEGIEVDEEKVSMLEGSVSRRDSSTYNYAGDKWGGKYLRAPDIFYTILEKGKDKLVRLGVISEVMRQGFTTGANDFFYLNDDVIKAKRIEHRFLHPVVITLKDSQHILIKPENLQYKVIIVRESKKQLEGTSLVNYIIEGEKKGLHKRPTCAARSPWYDLGGSIAPILHSIYLGDRLLTLDNTIAKAYSDHNLHHIYPRTGIKTEVLCAILNSLVFFLFRDLNARQLTGAYTVAGIDTFTLSRLAIISPTSLDNSSVDKILKAYNKLARREIRSIIEECGFNNENPIRSQQPNPLPDRKALDDVVFDALGLTEAERKEVYWAVCELVQNRLKKARSV
jgi:hypothetical protein